MSMLPFSYTLRRSQRAVKVRIVVTADKVEVVAPLKVPERRIEQFVHDKQQWIIQALAKTAEKNRHQHSLRPAVYSDGAVIPYLGNFYNLTIRPSKLKKIKIEFAGGFLAHVPEVWLDREHSDDVKAALTLWMKKQAVFHVQELVNRHALKNRLFPRTISIKTQKSRWGSCGIHNDIHINWLLIMAPPEVLEYVVVHELCHIRVRNHSTHFWDLVREHLPDYQNQRRWLKQHGGNLMRG